MNSNLDNIDPSSPYSYILKAIADILMIFVPSIGYFFQAMKFKQTKSSKGFAKFLCLLLLLANILRIFFWMGKRFTLTLLFQAIVVVISQIYLIHVYLEFQEDQPFYNKERTITDYLTNWKETLNPKNIWNWVDEVEYYKFIIFLFFIFSIMCSLAGFKNTKFFEVIGTISVSCETFIEIPQILENYKTKNTQNLSGAMVLMWFLGDLFKTTYNLMYKSPMQMIIGGIIMNCEDIILSSQVLIYSENSILNKIFKKKNKYVNLEDVKKTNESNKIDFDTEKQ
jgi:uncharacterized protein with PQ loop repeat